jgi:hypothetical protein
VTALHCLRRFLAAADRTVKSEAFESYAVKKPESDQECQMPAVHCKGLLR